MTWRSEAACLGHDPMLWFPGALGSSREAMRICWTECDVRLECLEVGMRTQYERRSGIFGGLSAAERQRLYRQRSAA